MGLPFHPQDGYPIVVALIAAFASCFTAWRSQRNGRAIQRIQVHVNGNLSALRRELAEALAEVARLKAALRELELPAHPARRPGGNVPP